MSEHTAIESLTKGLSRRTQTIIVLVMAGLGAAAYAVHALRAGTAAAVPAPGRAATAGSFRPTPEQLAGLRVRAVGLQSFRGEQLTEGRIALNADRTTPVFAPYSGRVVRVLANPGDEVKRGAPLLEVEASEFAQLQNDLIAGAASVATARSQLALDQAAERRKHGLFDARAGSLQDWQQAQAGLASSQNALRSAETGLTLVRNRLHILGRTDAQIARLENAERADPLAQVLAPLAGTVIDRQVGPGQFIQAGAASPVFSIADLRSLWLVANVRETDAPAMRLGASVEVRVLALPDRVYRAHIVHVAPAVDPATRRVSVRAEVQNPDGLLKPEMFASFRITTSAQTQSPAVPESALVYDGQSARLWVLREDGTLVSRPVVIGRSAQTMVEVVSGLRAGERVVTSGALFIDRAASGD